MASEGASAVLEPTIVAPRRSWLNVAIPIFVALVIIGIAVILVLAGTIFAADPMTGT
jgi:hypothetical protein